MGTLSVTASGFANFPATAPAGWPSNMTWPGNSAVNGTKSYTISDADWVSIMVWAANANNAQLIAASPSPPPAPPPYTLTGANVLLSLVQNWINGIIQAVQHQFTTAPSVPPPVSIA
jgi:hypothetical protein